MHQNFTFAASVAVGLAVGLSATAQAQLRPYTVDDVMNLETAGDGAGQGKLIVWEQAPAYDKIGFYGNNHTGAWGRTGFQLRTVSLSGAAPNAQMLFKPEPGVSYWIDSLSPDARYVAFYASRAGVHFMGAYDTQTKQLKTFDRTPLIDWSQGRESVWISPEEFVFSAYDGDEQPLSGVRPYTGRKLEENWKKAWNGGLSVSVNTTGLNEGGAPEWKEGRLFRANARTGALTLLSEGVFESLKVSDDGRYLAALRQGELPPPDPKKPNIDWVRTRSQLTLFDLKAGGAGKPIAPQKLVFIETLAWAPGANRLAFYAWNEGEGVQAGYFHAFDVATGKIAAYPHKGLDLASERERGFAQKPERAMWVDGRLAVLARKHSGQQALLTYRDIVRKGSSSDPGKADWFLLDEQGKVENLTTQFKEVSPVPLYADAKGIAILADGDVWRVGPGVQPKNLTASVSALSLPSSMRYSTKHRAFSGETILVSEDAKKPAFALIDFSKDSVAAIDSPAADAQFLGGAVKAGMVLFRYDHENGADIILKQADGKQTVLTRLNEFMAGVIKTRWQTISHTVKSHIGERKVESCVLLPANYSQGKRYPVIVEIYPGRGANCTKASSQAHDAIGRAPSPASEHLLAAKGYVVIQPNTSSDLIQTKDGPLGGMASMTEQAVQALVDQGYGDPQRVGLMGFSQGGFSSLWLATQSKLFKATVSLNGWSDMYVHYFETSYLNKFSQPEMKGSAGRYEATAGTDFPIGKKPYADPLAYIKPSPVFNAPTVSAPVMLIHSDMDTFNLNEYESMYVALNLNGKKAKLLRYWGEGHGPSSPANIRHMWGEIYAWFDRYVANRAQ